MNIRGALLLAAFMSIFLFSYAKADDPCEDAIPTVKHLTAALPQLSAEDAQKGKFEVDDLFSKGGEKAIVVSYRVNGKKLFEQKVVGSEEPTDNMTMSATTNKGNGALKMNFLYGVSGAISCHYIVSPRVTSDGKVKWQHKYVAK